MSYTSDDHFPQEDFTDTNPGLDSTDDDLDSDWMGEEYFEGLERFYLQGRSEDEVSPLQALRIRLGLESSLGENRLSIDALLSDLFSSRWTTRVSAVRTLEVLGRQSPPRVMRALMCVLDDRSEFVRAAAAQALGRTGEQSVRTRLLLAVGDRAWNVRASVVQALGNLGGDVPVETLLGLLGVCGDPDPSVRVAAVSALGRLKRPVLLGSLVGVLGDSDPSVRLAAVQVLKEQGERVPVEALLPAFSDADEDVRLEVLKTFGKGAAVDVLLRALDDENEDIRLAALGFLGDKGEQAPLERLLLALRDRNERVRTEAVGLLGRFADQIVKQVSSQFLDSLLQDDVAQLRAVAVWVLGERKDRTARHSLLAAINDQDEMVRSLAVWALRSLGDNAVWASSPKESQYLPLGTRVRLGGELDRQAFMQRLFSALMEYFGDKRGYVYPEMKETSSGRVLVLRCYCQSEGSSLKETVLSEIGGRASVTQLDAALRSKDDLVREVTSQIVENLAFEKRPWRELLVVSLSLLRDTDARLYASQPTRVVLCSTSVHRVRATDVSVLRQIMALFERSFVCTSSVGVGMDLWGETERPSGSLQDTFFGEEVFNCSSRADLRTVLEDFQIWYGSPMLQANDTGPLDQWGMRSASYIS